MRAREAARALPLVLLTLAACDPVDHGFGPGSPDAATGPDGAPSSVDSGAPSPVDASHEGAVSADSSSDAPAASDGGPHSDGGARDAGPTEPPDDGGPCGLAGTWAMLLEANLTWQAGGLVTCPAAGCEGTSRFELVSERTVDSAGAVTDAVRLCSVVVPQLQTNGGPISFSFQNPMISPREPLVPRFVSSVEPGTHAFQSGNGALFLGVNLQVPVTETWPAPGTFTPWDHDEDGYPGVSAATAAPLSATGPVANYVFVALRSVLSFRGVLESCTFGTGSVAGSRFDLSFVGCTRGNTGCTAAQTKYLNDNLAPPRTFNASSRFELRRLSPGGSCEDVTAAFARR